MCFGIRFWSYFQSSQFKNRHSQNETETKNCEKFWMNIKSITNRWFDCLKPRYFFFFFDEFMWNEWRKPLRQQMKHTDRNQIKMGREKEKRTQNYKVNLMKTTNLRLIYSVLMQYIDVFSNDIQLNIWIFCVVAHLMMV